MKRLGLIVAVLGLSYLSACGPSEVSVTTQRYDSARTGQNLFETVLNTSNVNSVSFGKLFTRAVDDEIYAQPLNVVDRNVTTSSHRALGLYPDCAARVSCRGPFNGGGAGAV